jgi:hypothetical protein
MNQIAAQYRADILSTRARVLEIVSEIVCARIYLAEDNPTFHRVVEVRPLVESLMIQTPSINDKKRPKP